MEIRDWLESEQESIRKYIYGIWGDSVHVMTLKNKRERVKEVHRANRMKVNCY